MAVNGFKGPRISRVRAAGEHMHQLQEWGRASSSVNTLFNRLTTLTIKYAHPLPLVTQEPWAQPCWIRHVGTLTTCSSIDIGPDINHKRILWTLT